MEIPKTRWFLLPLCLLFGLTLLFAFVRLSQNYLSGYMVRNSTPLLGQKLEWKSLSEHLEDPRLADFPGASPQKEVLLVFWSTSCAPCLSDLPQLKTEHPEALIVAINTDTEDDWEHAEKISKLLAPDIPFLKDRRRFLETQLKIDYLPTHVLASADGTLLKFTVGRDKTP